MGPQTNSTFQNLVRCVRLKLTWQRQNRTHLIYSSIVFLTMCTMESENNTDTQTQWLLHLTTGGGNP